METSVERSVAGADLSGPLDLLLVNAPLRDYALRPRVNDFMLPLLGMGYIATYAAAAASTSASSTPRPSVSAWARPNG
jgi:hypothetical protein